MADIVEKFDQMREGLMLKLRIRRSYATVFSTDEGKTVLKHILNAAYVGKSTFVAGDPEQTMLNEGSRRLALSILRLATDNNDEQIRLIEEQLKL